MNYGLLRHLWEIAYESSSVTEDVGSQAMQETDTGEEIELSNLGSDTIAIILDGIVKLTASDAEVPITGRILTDILDNITVKDPNGKTVIDLSWRTAYNYCGFFLNEAPVMDTIPTFAKAGTATARFHLLIPIFIPRDQGIHKLEIDYNLANIYAADVGLANGALISISICTGDQTGLMKWKAVDQSVAIVDGPNTITKLENDRPWYAVGIMALRDGNDNDEYSIDDVKLVNKSVGLITTKYYKLAAASDERTEFTTRATPDTMLSFRAHLHASTDLFMLEGDEALTISLLLIAQADPSRGVTTPEVTGGSAPQTSQVPVLVTMNPAVSGVTQPSQQGAMKILPVPISTGY